MTRAILDALGHEGVEVPRVMKLELLPGVIREWRIRPAPGSALDEKGVAALKPDDGWKTYTLPEKEVLSSWWPEQERQRGFAQSLVKLVGPCQRFEAIAVVEAEKPRDVVFSTGAQLETIWLNGKRIYKSEGWTGWHAGKECIPARLQAGKNTVVIETGPAFFVSITPE